MRHIYLMATAKSNFIHSAVSRDRGQTSCLSLAARFLSDQQLHQSIAYIGFVFDGWDNTMDSLSEYMTADWALTLKSVARREHGVVIPVQQVALLKPLSISVPAERLNHYAMRQLVDGINTARKFSLATHCDVVIDYDVIGGVVDDSEFPA